MEKVRESYLDAARGACVLSVMFIHTVYWSGGAYVPEFFRTLALLLDVPAFFFLAGITLAVTGKGRVPAAAFSFVLYFSVLAFIHDALSGEWSFYNLLQCLLLQTPDMKYLPVVGGSYWFVPVYVAVSLFCVALVECAPRLIKPLTPLLFAYYALDYFFFPQWKNTQVAFMGTSMQYLFFYMGLFLFGWLAWKEWLGRGITRPFWGLAVAALLSYTAIWAYGGDQVLLLQNYKFRPQLPYVVISFLSIGVICALWSNARRSRALESMGKNALAWYAGQGVGASLLMFVAPLLAWPWPIKMPLLFALNVLCAALVATILLALDKALRALLRPVQAK